MVGTFGAGRVAPVVHPSARGASASGGGGTAGSMTAAVLRSQHRAIEIARDATTARVLGLELLAAHVGALARPESR